MSKRQLNIIDLFGKPKVQGTLHSNGSVTALPSSIGNDIMLPLRNEDDTTLPSSNEDENDTAVPSSSNSNNDQLNQESTISTNQYDIGNFVNQNDIQEIPNLLLSIWKPEKMYDFPCVTQNKRKRRFQYDWLDKFPWLAYSEKLSGAFCKWCVLFQRKEGHNKKLGRLVTESFCNYKKANEIFKHHETCEYHKFSKQQAKSILLVASGQQNVAGQISKVNDIQRTKNRDLLTAIIDTLLLLAKQNISIRGHSETDPDQNSGNFREFSKFQAAKNPDLKILLDNSKKNASYLSPEIQNEILSLAANQLIKQIVSEINESKYFSILADEATDQANKAVLTLSVRYYYNSKAIESFIGFLQMEKTDAEAISKAVIAYLTKIGLNLSFMRAQCFDGASVMSGHINGVQTRIRQICPKAFYVHCSSHALNLVLNSAAGSTVVNYIVEKVKMIVLYFKKSPKREEMLRKHILADGKTNKLATICTTRWVERHESIQRFVDHFFPVVQALRESKGTSIGQENVQVTDFLNSLTYEFIFTLHMLANLTSELVPISCALQKVGADLIGALNRINNLKSDLLIAKNDRRRYNKIYDQAYLAMAKCELGNEFIQFDKTKFESAREQYWSTIYTKYIQKLLEQMEIRFNTSTRNIYKLQYLIPAFFTHSDAIIQSIFTFMEDDLDCSASSFSAEYNMWKDQFKTKSTDLPDNALDALNMCNSQFEANISTALKILAIIPVTTSSSERSFSTLKRLKTYLRSSMTEEICSNLALLNIHFNRKIIVEKIINDFAINSRRIDL